MKQIFLATVKENENQRVVGINLKFTRVR